MLPREIPATGNLNFCNGLVTLSFARAIAEW